MTTDYSAATWTSANLLADLRRKAKLPDSATDYTDSVLLREATDCLWSFAGFAMQQARDGRLTFSLTRSIASNAVTSTDDEVELPPFAVADTISSVVWVDASGPEKVLQPVTLDQEAIYDDPEDSGEPWGYALLDGRLRLFPRPSDDTGSVRIIYQRRHGDLVASSSTSTVLSIASIGDGSTCSITTASAPASGIVTNAWIDVMNPTYPYRIELADVKCTNVTGSVLTLALPYATLAAVSPTSMTVASSGQTPYVHLPLEMRQPFTEYAAAAILRQIGDEVGAQAYEQSAREGLSRSINMLNPRTKGSREKIVNPHSLLRGGPRRGLRWTRESW